jgi:hypothetical protein
MIQRCFGCRKELNGESYYRSYYASGSFLNALFCRACFDHKSYHCYCVYHGERITKENLHEHQECLLDFLIDGWIRSDTGVPHY